MQEGSVFNNLEVRKGRYIRFLSGHDELAVCEDKCCLFVAKKEKN